MNLFQLGDFTLHGGGKSRWRIDCDALSDGDIATLARMITGSFHYEFARVEGIPRGGLRLADALRLFVNPAARRNVLIVDDVLTTGVSMRQAMRACVARGDFCMGVVLFAHNPCPCGVVAVFQMPEEMSLDMGRHPGPGPRYVRPNGRPGG